MTCILRRTTPFDANTVAGFLPSFHCCVTASVHDIQVLSIIQISKHDRPGLNPHDFPSPVPRVADFAESVLIDVE